MGRPLLKRIFKGLTVPPIEGQQMPEPSETQIINGETPITYSGPGGIRVTETPTESRIKIELKKAAREMNTRMPSEKKG